jgi:hypothetical protein
MEDFSFLQLRRADLKEIHQAMLLQWLVEERLRNANGLEGTDPPLLLGRLETLLNLSPDGAHELFHVVDDMLWEHSWINYIEEWAWRRADEDVRQELGTRLKYMDEEQLETLIEHRSEDKFEKYSREIALDRNERTGKTGKKKARDVDRGT